MDRKEVKMSVPVPRVVNVDNVDSCEKCGLYYDERCDSCKMPWVKRCGVCGSVYLGSDDIGICPSCYV